ncbi:pentapeptide repeat-containing protein, partial [Vibrio parahaemolyticus]
DLVLCDAKLGDLAKIVDTVFIGCKFSDCDFSINNMENVTFINCDFYKCIVTDLDGQGNDNVHFAGCKANNDFINLINSEDDDLESSTESGLDDSDLYVLEKFYPRGSQTFHKHR